MSQLDIIPSHLIPLKKRQALTPKQILFVQHYIETGNQQKAAEMAGYTPTKTNAIATKLMRNPNINEAIRAYRSEIANRIVCTFEEKARLLWEIAQRCSKPTQTMINGKPSEVDRSPTAIKAIEVLNAMQGHIAPDQSLNINVQTTIKKLKELQIEYLDH